MEKPGQSSNSSVWEGWTGSFLELESDRYLLEYRVIPGQLFQGRGVRIFSLPLAGSHPACRECPGKPPQDQPLGSKAWISPFPVTFPVTRSHSDVNGIMSLQWENMEFQGMLQSAGMARMQLRIPSCTFQASPFH